MIHLFVRNPESGDVQSVKIEPGSELIVRVDAHPTLESSQAAFTRLANAIGSPLDIGLTEPPESEPAIIDQRNYGQEVADMQGPSGSQPPQE